MTLKRLLAFSFFILAAGGFFFFSQTTKTLTYEKDAVLGEVKVPLQPQPPPPPPAHVRTPEPVKAIYMTSWVAGTGSLRKGLIEFIDKSEINSVVIDIKDATGKISFDTGDEVIESYGSEDVDRISDIKSLIEDLHRKDIYIIGRISVFQDPYMTSKMPNAAVLNVGGGIWKDRKGLSFMDPGAKEYWDYIVRLAKASERVGFDEINFDYIRFPSDGNMAAAVYPFLKGREKQVALEDFFIYLDSELKDTDVATSADLFGLVTWAENDLNIGQVLERAAPHFDYIAPMVYPSHYAAGFEGFKKPAEHPYEVIHISLTRAVERMQKAGEDPKKLRPWIQDFDLGAQYGVKEIEAQKKAIYDAGLTSWMAWDPANEYTRSAYQE